MRSLSGKTAMKAFSGAASLLTLQRAASQKKPGRPHPIIVLKLDSVVAQDSTCVLHNIRDAFRCITVPQESRGCPKTEREIIALKIFLLRSSCKKVRFNRSIKSFFRGKVYFIVPVHPQKMAKAWSSSVITATSIQPEWEIVNDDALYSFLCNIRALGFQSKRRWGSWQSSFRVSADVLFATLSKKI